MEYKGFEIKETTYDWFDGASWHPVYRISHPQLFWSPEFHSVDEAKEYIDQMISLADQK